MTLTFHVFNICFRLFFGGTIPHIFYQILDRFITGDATPDAIKKLLIERLFYVPLFQAFVIYMIARLEGKTHNQTIVQLEASYWPILQANWKYLTLIQFLNLAYVPPVVRIYTFLNLNCRTLIVDFLIFK